MALNGLNHVLASKRKLPQLAHMGHMDVLSTLYRGEGGGGKNENASSVYIVCCVLCGGGVDGGVLPRRRRRRLLRYPNPISSSLAPSASSPPPPSRRLTIESRAPRAVHRRSAVTGSIIEQTNRNDQLGNRTVLEDLST